MKCHYCGRCEVSTHSRLKAAGDGFVVVEFGFAVSTHSRLKAAGKEFNKIAKHINMFQHTAA